MTACHTCAPSHNRDVRDFGMCSCPCHRSRSAVQPVRAARVDKFERSDFLNEHGRRVIMTVGASVDGTEVRVLATAQGTHTDHTWTHREAFVLHNLLTSVLRTRTQSGNVDDMEQTTPPVDMAPPPAARHDISALTRANIVTAIESMSARELLDVLDAVDDVLAARS
jgi:hypothetical protein